MRMLLEVARISRVKGPEMSRYRAQQSRILTTNLGNLSAPDCTSCPDLSVEIVHKIVQIPAPPWHRFHEGEIFPNSGVVLLTSGREEDSLWTPLPGYGDWYCFFLGAGRGSAGSKEREVSPDIEDSVGDTVSDRLSACPYVARPSLFP